MYALDISANFDFSVDAIARESTACGSVYRVEPGDTLHEIATRAYGTGNYQVIFEANRKTLKSAAKLDVGDKLLIPCLRGNSPSIGAGVAARISTPKIKPEADNAGSRITTSGLAGADGGSTTNASNAMPDDGSIDFLTGSDFAPFVHPASPQGGMITELIRLSMSHAGQETAFKIAQVEDWSAHLDLLARRRFDLGFPWYRPDCAKAEALSASMQRRCAEFDFSDPLYEVAIGYYVQAHDPLAEAAGYEQLSGRRICRPANHFTFDLEQQGLVEPNAILITPPKVSDCLAWLERGEVDVVTLSKLQAEAEITRLGHLGRFAEIPALASGQTLHVVARKGDPQARGYLELVNAGLADLQASGRLFEVASRHFGTYGLRVR
jgi:polar amino acid transport system substrate-binding protein